MRMKRACGLIALTLGLVACGGSPTAPAPASIAGTWTGTIQGTQPVTGPFFAAIIFNLTQAGASVNGTYVVSAGATFAGTISGATTATSFSGTLTFQTTTTAGGSCTGTWAVSGPAGGITMNWTSPGITANCTNLPVNIVMALQRQ